MLPFFAISMFATGTDWKDAHRVEMTRYVVSRQNADGGWGLHIEGPSIVFGTIINYVALRLLGIPEGHECTAKATRWIRDNYDATYIPTWGKFWLATIGLYDYEGMYPILPELLLLPDWLPLHPKNMWCHSRQVYLSMSYIYGRRWSRSACPLIEELRRDLYPGKQYGSINWRACRSRCSPLDLAHPHSSLYTAASLLFAQYERLPGYITKRTRSAALREAERLITYEDEATNYLCLGPVNKAGNLLASYIMHGGRSTRFSKHVDRMYHFLWMTREGILVCGTNGTQLWDTSFAIQAASEAGLVSEPKFAGFMSKAYAFLDSSQLRENHVDYARNHRHATKGAWPFSTKAQGYTVSDCTAEALLSVLAIHSLNANDALKFQRIEEFRLREAVDILLGMQNADGGFASYELCRAGTWAEAFNGFELFCNIMVEYTYVECTSSVALALVKFLKLHPDYRSADINAALRSALAYIKGQQMEDGSFYGSWAVCYTYATWFALEAMAAMGLNYNNSQSVKRACDFLISKQNKGDGGWGESYSSCERQEYVSHPEGSQVVNTSWAILGLLAAKFSDRAALTKGVQLIIDRQLPDGSYRQEGIEGVFNKSCMISYPNYKLVFPVWALSRFSRTYGDPTVRVTCRKLTRQPSFIHSKLV